MLFLCNITAILVIIYNFDLAPLVTPNISGSPVLTPLSNTSSEDSTDSVNRRMEYVYQIELIKRLKFIMK